MKVKKGKTDPKLYGNDDWFIRQFDQTIVQLRPTEKKHIKEMWVGSVNGMARVGQFEIATSSWNYYSTAYFQEGIGLMPGSLRVWSIFLAEYVNSITDPDTISEDDGS